MDVRIMWQSVHMRSQADKLSAEDLAASWAEWHFSRTISARNALLLHYNSYVRAIAAQLVKTLPSMVDREDLISWGVFGLMKAIDRFEPEHGVKFETFAMSRIKGEMYDGLRKLDWLPRDIRSRVSDLEKAGKELHALYGRPATNDELADYLNLSLRELWNLQHHAVSSQLNPLDDGSPDDSGEIHGMVPDRAADPADQFETSEVAGLLASAIDSLAGRSKTILVLYYVYELTLAEIGEILGVTESRVCQLQSKLLKSLQMNLGGSLAA
jgi:RNA polymerase sigma factor for flagellar operon FliA